MKRLKKGMTLLVTTVALSFVTIVSAAFSGIYFRYGQMNTGFYDDDREKILLRNEANTTFETFLKDEEVEDLNGQSKKLRTEWIDNELTIDNSLRLKVNDLVVTFVALNAEKTTVRFLISSNNNTLQTLIEKGESYSLHFEKFVPRG